jgi:hypothetical protein
MMKISEFRQHAVECSTLAQRMGAAGKQRDMMLRLATTWDQLADRRERELVKRGLPADYEGEIG